jgi:hypothetical protein
MYRHLVSYYVLSHDLIWIEYRTETGESGEETMSSDQFHARYGFHTLTPPTD